MQFKEAKIIEKCDICFLLSNTADQLVETERWVIKLSKNQAYLGRSFVTLRRHVGSLEELDGKDWEEFQFLVRSMEFACKSVFNATPFNWGCYMNKAFKDFPYSPHVHWHLFPRYSQPVKFSDVIFEDSNYGEMFDETAEKVVSDTIYEQIKYYLQHAIKT